MKLLKIIIGVAIAYNIATTAMANFKSEEWMSFVYPNANNLYNDKFGGTFGSLEECRTASKDMLASMNATYSGDYECGLDCDTSRGKPYICETTSR